MPEDVFGGLRETARVQLLETERMIASSLLVGIPIFLVFIADKVGLNSLAVASVILLFGSLLYSFWILLEIKETLRSSWQVGFEGPRQKEELAKTLRAGAQPREALIESNKTMLPLIQKVAGKRILIDRLIKIAWFLFALGVALLVCSLLLDK